MLSVRKTKDLALIEKLDQQIFGDKDTETDCFGKYDDPHALWWVAYVDGLPAGFAGLKLFKEGSAECAYLNRAGVLKTYRGRGIQKEFIKARDREAKRRGLHMIITYTERYNYPSANSLVACGYRLYKPEYRWGFGDALYFWKKFT